MSKTGKLSATEELTKLEDWFRAEREKLAEQVEAENEKARIANAAAEEKRLGKLREDAVEHAEYLVDLASKASKLTDELHRVLIERRDSADDFRAKFGEVCNFGHHYHHSQNYKIGLSSVLNLSRIDARSSAQTFLDLDIRALHSVLPAKTLARATA